jgi:hypothetical protein
VEFDGVAIVPERAAGVGRVRELQVPQESVIANHVFVFVFFFF